MALLLSSQLSQNGNKYEYKYVLDQGTFELVLRVLQIMQDGVDALKEAIFSLFSWTDFVTGGGVDDSLIGNIDVTGDKIRYDTVENCVKEVTYFNSDRRTVGKPSLWNKQCWCCRVRTNFSGDCNFHFYWPECNTGNHENFCRAKWRICTQCRHQSFFCEKCGNSLGIDL